MLYNIAYAVAIAYILRGFYTGYKQSTKKFEFPTWDQQIAPDYQEVLPEDHNTTNYLTPIVSEGAPLSVYAWINYDYPSSFLDVIRQGNWAKLGSPVWSDTSGKLKYEQLDENNRQMNISLPLGNSTQDELYY